MFVFFSNSAEFLSLRTSPPTTWYAPGFKDFFVVVGPPKQDIFLATFYGLNFSHHFYTYYKLQSFHLY